MSWLHVWYANDSNVPPHPGWGDDDFPSARTGNARVDDLLVDLSLVLDRLDYRLFDLNDITPVMSAESRAALDRARETTKRAEFLLYLLHREFSEPRGRRVRVRR